MRLVAIALAALVLAGCAAAPAPPPTNAAPAVAAARPLAALRNASFDADIPANGRCAPGWDCTMHSNPDAFRFFLQDGAAAGGRSLCVQRVADEPWAMVTQAFEDPRLRDKRVRLSMAVHVEGATGEGAGPFVQVQANPPRNPPPGAHRFVRGSAAWQRVAIELLVPKDALVVEVGALLVGPGKACFDDVRLEVEPG